ncbi:MAG: hypothetical protein LC667_03205 [Thioalkalivibrio sp.]|nr:hypothetical protein [Thioalkalivibrio sp.]
MTLWAGTPPSARDNLFTSGSVDARFTLLAAAEVPPEVSAPLDTLHAMLSLGSGADAGVVSVCCLEVAAWARRAGLPHTGIAFAQAGALASPEFAEAALTVGVAARAAGQDARAATWLRRAVALARREGDWVAYASARVELGRLAEREQPGNAERNYQMALRKARRHGARSERMRAAHGLFRLARQRGDLEGAAQFAQAAQRVFDASDAGAQALLMDLARFWMDTAQPKRARPAVQRLALMMEGLVPADQLVTLAMMARVHAESLKSYLWCDRPVPPLDRAS